MVFCGLGQTFILRSFMTDAPINNRKKILFVTPTRATFPFLNELIHRLTAADWEVHYATSEFQFSDKSATEFPSMVRQHWIPLARGANPWRHWRASQKLREIVQLVRPDVIDVHFSAAMLTVALAKKNDWPPTFATIHGLRFPQQVGLRRWVESLVEGWASQRMDRVWLLTADDRDVLQTKIGAKAALVGSVGLGCDLVRFDRNRFTESEQKQARRQAGALETETVLIFVGRKVSFKGYDLAIRAFLSAVALRPDLRLLVCGTDDPFHSTGLSVREENIVRDHPKINQLGWIDNVENFLSISVITLFPSRREGMPVNLMESLAMGVPVITCDSRGCRDVVDHQTTGLVLPSFDVSLISEAILQLSADQALRGKFSQNAIAKRALFDRQRFVEERFELFQQTVNST